jgi:hypothetical protein
MISFRMSQKSLEVNGKEVKFDFPISHIVFVDNIFYILFDPLSDNKISGQFHNLCGINIAGDIIWKAELPNTQPDCFLNIYLKDNKLHAYSFSAYDCIIDPVTGKVIYSELCK